MAYNVKGVPWKAMPGSVDVSDCETSLEVMEKSRLDYKVEKCPLVAKMQINSNENDGDDLDKLFDKVSNSGGFIRNKEAYIDCPNAYSTYRIDENIPLGVVKSRYEVVQNRDAFKFFDDAIGKDKAIFQRAGYFGKGERIFVAVKLPTTIKVKDDICEEYLVFTNSHDGNRSVEILFTPIRIVCQNTLNAAIRSAENFVRFRHTANVHKQIATGSEILGISKEKSKLTEALYNQLANIKVTDKEVMDYIAKVQLTGSEYDATMQASNENLMKVFIRDSQTFYDSKLSMRKLNTLCETFDYYSNGIGQKEIAGTAWGMYNAITGHISNCSNDTGEKRMDTLLYGSGYNKMLQSLELSINY